MSLLKMINIQLLNKLGMGRVQLPAVDHRASYILVQSLLQILCPTSFETEF